MASVVRNAGGDPILPSVATRIAGRGQASRVAVLLALLAALVQAAMAVLVPLPAPPIVPLTAAEQYAHQPPR